METRLSEHFTLEEFTRSATAAAHYIRNTPPAAAVENLHYLCNKVLEPARLRLGEPIVITSGYRCQKLNRLVGGVKNSQHTTGEAADIRLPSMEYGNELFDILAASPFVDQLLFEHSGKTIWLHVSCSPHRQPRRMTRKYYRV